MSSDPATSDARGVRRSDGNLAGFTPFDFDRMSQALCLARRGEGWVEPNPMVGCVIARDGKILGAGWHRRFGQAHAEVNALRNCGASARGATAFVTLEPCRHQGKTPPCVHALIEAGIKRVVVAVRDPDPRMRGRSLRTLRAAGIEVQEGLCAEAARSLIAPFKMRITRGLPWIILKWAQSIDGRIATRRRALEWLSDGAQLRDAHRVRARVDAIVVGVGTVLVDDPRLTARDVPVRRVARRVVLDSTLRTPVTSNLVRSAGQTPTWIYCGAGAATRRVRALERHGCRVLRSKSRRWPVEAVAAHLAAKGCTNVLVEGGSEVLGRFLDAGMADEIHVYMAPLLIGGEQAVPAIGGRGAASVRQAVTLPRGAQWKRLGHGWALRERLSTPS